MIIKRVDTRTKGVVIRYIFDDIEEYNLTMENLHSTERILENEKCKEDIRELITLFQNYYVPESPYCDNKPAVTVFENHLLTIAVQLALFTPLCLTFFSKILDMKREYTKLQEKYINTLKNYNDGNTQEICSLNSEPGLRTGDVADHEEYLPAKGTASCGCD